MASAGIADPTIFFNVGRSVNACTLCFAVALALPAPVA
jgi:hypothetical protein